MYGSSKASTLISFERCSVCNSLRAVSLFSLSVEQNARDTQWPRAWLTARDGRGRKKRDCSQSKFVRKLEILIVWENGSHFATPPRWFPYEMTSEQRAQKFYKWGDTTGVWLVLLVGWNFASTNQKHYPDLDSDASSVWNLCARFSNVISRGNQW